MAPSGRFAVVEERLAYRPPFDGEALLRFLARRAIPGVEEVDGETYRRSLSLPSGPGTVELSPRRRLRPGAHRGARSS